MFDEVKIKDLAYDKHSGDIIGFFNLDEVNNQLLAPEQKHLNASPQPQLATHMSVFMVCGILPNLEFDMLSSHAHQLLVTSFIHLCGVVYVI